ncbi:MAG: N-acetyltransferase [bacterium]|nr:N-acetyltransferase [bacterium]
MNHQIREVSDGDAEHIVSIFNYFVGNSFAAYMEKEGGPEIFDRFMKTATAFLVLEVEGKPVGFALLRPYFPYENDYGVGTLTYFILPQYTGQGFGSMLLNRIVEVAVEKRVTNLLAHISSRNTQSLNFHRKHGFVECGRFKKMGVKFGESFDVVWVQRFLDRELVPGPS